MKFLALFLFGLGSWANAQEVARWTRFETHFQSRERYQNPLQEMRVFVDFFGPGESKQTVLAFWDGENAWRVRFSPDRTGRWHFQTRSVPEDVGLHNQTGAFVCVPYRGENPLYRRGPLRLSDNRRYLVHADGTPFFWLGDTAWNGALLSRPEDWELYLKDRVKKSFTAIQFVTTQWRAALADRQGEVAFTGREEIAINPAFYQRLDQRVDAINDHGLVAAPVLLWSCCPSNPGPSPGLTLAEEQLKVLAEYMVARYGAHQLIWILGGDGDYRGEKAEPWKRIGRAVFDSGHGLGHPVTLHPGGRHFVADGFRSERWFTFNGYQSGHGDDDRTFRWLLFGPPSENWKKDPPHPDINLEPNYEGHRGYVLKVTFDDRAVRRAAYWSLLIAPPAGVSYGAHGIWPWNEEAQVPLNHPNAGVAPPWREALNAPGSTSMKHLAALFSSLEWWKLRPAQEMLAEPPGQKDLQRFVVVARAEDRSWSLVYTPSGDRIMLLLGRRPDRSRWFNPRSGEWSEAQGEFTTLTATYTPPDDQDWVLLLQ